MSKFCIDKAKHLHRFEFICVVNQLIQRNPTLNDAQLVKLLNRSHYSIRRGRFIIDTKDVALARCMLSDTCPSWPEGKLYYLTYKGEYHKGDPSELSDEVTQTLYDIGAILRNRVSHIRRHYAIVQAGIQRLTQEVRKRTVYWQDVLDETMTTFIASARRLIVNGQCVKRTWASKLWCIDTPNPVIPVEFHPLNTDTTRNAYRVYVIIGHVKVCLSRRYQYLRLE